MEAESEESVPDSGNATEGTEAFGSEGWLLKTEIAVRSSSVAVASFEEARSSGLPNIQYQVLGLAAVLIAKSINPSSAIKASNRS